MSIATKKRSIPPASTAKPISKGAHPAMAKSARPSQLRAQTRKLLGKHYRAKYGVR